MACFGLSALSRTHTHIHAMVAWRTFIPDGWRLWQSLLSPCWLPERNTRSHDVPFDANRDSKSEYPLSVSQACAWKDMASGCRSRKQTCHLLYKKQEQEMRVHRQYLDVLSMLKSAVPSPCAGERLEGHERVDAGAGDGPRVGGGAAGAACGGRSRCESHDINDPQQCTTYTGACCWRRPRRVSSLKDVRVATHVERTLQL